MQIGKYLLRMNDTHNSSLPC